MHGHQSAITHVATCLSQCLVISGYVCFNVESCISSINSFMENYGCKTGIAVNDS